MDPNLFHVDMGRLIEVLVAIIVLSFFLERALAVVFEHRLWTSRKTVRLQGPDCLFISILRVQVLGFRCDQCHDPSRLDEHLGTSHYGRRDRRRQQGIHQALPRHDGSHERRGEEAERASSPWVEVRFLSSGGTHGWKQRRGR